MFRAGVKQGGKECKQRRGCYSCDAGFSSLSAGRGGCVGVVNSLIACARSRGDVSLFGSDVDSGHSRTHSDELTRARCRYFSTDCHEKRYVFD